ncbi:XPG_I-domain-containing protein [Chaetoceros tenuissimus]|uniref:XPG_I-domain-containing protein n=1 Tax=Chaetoceros tenuissimus TaxID=426638 RepID=A0AAD3H7H2_9STRA|nr:XPG_I-domain-containing protein [Chaetoceros tenuissimus]
MGVKGLWQLLLPTGRRISVETLQGKRLAVDASIWLTQFLKANRDPETGAVRANAHIIGFLRRICRLLYHGIRPVFVFDGATPEIKLREIRARRERRERLQSFKGDNDNEGVKRLARRILVAQLKKQKELEKAEGKLDNGKSVKDPMKVLKNMHKKNLKSTGAFSSGFNLPGEEEDGNASEDDVQQSIEIEEDDKDDEEDDEIDHDVLLVPSPDKKDDVLELSDSEDYLQSLTKEQQQTNNDWDNAIAAAESDSEESNESIELQDGENLDVEALQSLPTKTRVDVIEKARRQQRMNSRKEFMSVAANPDSYSQCQLRNFLKSANLNKTVHKLGKIVAMKGEDGQEGERIASDGTRRFIFKKDEESDDDEMIVRQQRKYNEQKRKANAAHEERVQNKSSPRKRLRQASHRNNDSDDDSILYEGPKVKNVDLFDDDSDSDGGGFIVQVPEQSNTRIGTNRHFTIASSDESDCDSGKAGFIMQPQQEENYRKEISKLQTQAKATTTETIDLASSDDESPEENAGRFLSKLSREDHTSNRDPITLESSSDDDEGGGFIQKEEAEDAEEEGGGFIQESETLSNPNIDFTTKNSPIHIASIEEEEGGGFIQAEDTNNIDDTVKAIEQIISSNQEVHRKDGLSFVGETEITSSELRNQSTIESAANPKSSIALSDEGDSDDEDDIDWEDGDDDDKQMDNLEETDSNICIKTPADVPSAEEKTSVEYPDDISIEVASEELTESKHSHNDIKEDSDSDVIWEDGNDFSSKAKEDANAVALKNAQATASHLTDWAGRAVQRAIKAHLAETDNQHQSEDSPSDDSDNDNEDEDNDGDEILQINNGPNKTPEEIKSKISNEDKKDEMKSTDIETVEEPSTEAFMNTSLEALQEEDAMMREEENRRERDMDQVTDEMIEEVMQLLQLFGIPYLRAPAEAEAQAAELEKLGLVDGVVTEDSDAIVFGSRNVYRNIFEDKKYVEVYMSSDSESIGLGLNEKIALAMLLGGDYTEGVKGVGIVNAMEVLKAFPVSTSVEEGLKEFRKWLDGFELEDKEDENPAIAEFKRKHRTARSRWVVPREFPAKPVLQAYSNPVVDSSKDAFSWGLPDLEALQVFCHKKMGWEKSETDHAIVPVLNEMKKGQRQTRLDGYFVMKAEDNIKFADIKSKRLREVWNLKKDSNKDEKH